MTSNKYLRDKNFWRWQNTVIVNLMNQIEDQTGVMFQDASPGLERELHCYMDDQSKYKSRSKMITYLEELLAS